MINNDSTLMQMLGSSMRYQSQRQGVLAQNISNVDTPGFKARDLKKQDFSAMASEAHGKLSMRATSPKHLTGLGNPADYRDENDRKTFEISPTGNNVVLDEQMAKISETGSQFQISQSLFKKFTGMYRLALGNR